mmetsp:Transcript_5734/g.17022  ORF Transcript_5734/g.17022 Transcript_5734/m.17022 type:complete len:215 (+) Transcript_5734:1087-1731(+)
MQYRSNRILLLTSSVRVSSCNTSIVCRSTVTIQINIMYVLLVGSLISDCEMDVGGPISVGANNWKMLSYSAASTIGGRDGGSDGRGAPVGSGVSIFPIEGGDVVMTNIVGDVRMSFALSSILLLLSDCGKRRAKTIAMTMTASMMTAPKIMKYKRFRFDRNDGSCCCSCIPSFDSFLFSTCSATTISRNNRFWIPASIKSSRFISFCTSRRMSS